MSVGASFLVFLGISAIVIATPGPDTALTIRNSLVGGRAAGIWTALGVSIGQLIWALATSAGIVAILLASEPVFRGVKLAGALYLVGLGAHSLWRAFRPDRRDGTSAERTGRGRLRSGAAFRQGVINNLGNPKMAVFFASVLPQFAPAGNGMFSVLLLLGGVFSALTFVWLASYAAAIAAIGRWLRTPPVRRTVEAASGAVLIGLGVRLAIEER
jgi:threonine/homoserine/homoserine lactone efflux protein